jgi:hypothetical protein
MKYIYVEDYEDYIRQWGFVDTSGNIVVPIMYGFAVSFSNGLAAVKSPGTEYNSSYKFGFIDRTGELVIPIEYYAGDQWSGYSSFNEHGFAVVWEEGWAERGIIDRHGNFVVPFGEYTFNYDEDGYRQMQFLSGGKKYRVIFEDSIRYRWEIVETENLSAPKTSDSIVSIFFYIVVSITGIKIKRRR